jgi:DNA-binding winged helix-turn-helix (wHTH) protein/predicted ATPase
VIYAFGDFELDTERYELRREGAHQHVEPQVFDVLAYLLAHRDRVVTREELLAQVWGHEFVSEATLSSRLMAVRKAIGDSGRAQTLIRTVRGRGYQFIAEVEERAAGSPPAGQIAAPRDVPEAIGRDAEIAQLSRLLDVATGGDRQFALVTGEAGVGKTTLVARFAGMAQSSSPVLIAIGRCLEHRGAAEPYMPVLEALGRASRGLEGERVIATLSGIAPTWLAQMPGLAQREDPDVLDEQAGAARPDRMLREMAEALEALSESLPVVLVLDDLHWADASTLELLAYVARRDDPARLLLIGTARPLGGSPVDELRRELRPRGKCVELALQPLGEDDVRTYLQTRYPGTESLASVIHGRTDGNPLFMDSLLRSWVDADALDSENEVWHATRDVQELAMDVPDTLRELLEQDFHRLAAEDREILDVASVVGESFSAAAVAAGLGSEVESVEGRCAELAHRARFLREQGPEEWPDGTVAAAFGFVHDLHRQVLYERIPAGRRARLHRDIGARLERGYGPEAVLRAPELAAHFLEAREPAAAVRYLRLAAEQAAARGAHRDAVQDLTKALELVERTPDLPDRHDQELSLRAALAGALIATEGWSSRAAEEAYRRALALARRLGDDGSIAIMLFGLASLHEYRGEYPSSEALLAEALRVEGAPPDASGRLAAYELMSCSLFHQGSFGASIDHANRGLALHEPGQRHPDHAFYGEDPAVSCNDWAGLALWCIGRPDEALERIRAALELAGEPGRGYSLASARMHAARLHHLRREPEEALERAEAALAQARERGYAYQSAAAMILLGWAQSALGEPEVGVELMQQGLAAHRATGADMDRPYFLALLAEGWRDAGRAREGLATIGEALEMLRGGRSFFYEAELHRLHGTLRLMGSGGEEAAESSFRWALEVARRQEARSLELRAAVSLARLLHEQASTGAALRALGDPYEWFSERAETADLREARALLADLRS